MLDVPGTLDLAIVQQRTWRVGLTFTNDDQTPIDLTGATLRLRAVHVAHPSSTFDISTATSGITLDDAPNGEATILVGSDVTAALERGTWRYDFFISRTGVENDDVPFRGALTVIGTIGGAS